MNVVVENDLTLIGLDRDGEPIYLIQGGAPEDDEGGDDAFDVDGDDEDEGEDGEDVDDDGEDGDDEPEDKKPAPAKKVAPKKVTNTQRRDPNSKGPNYDLTLKRERIRARNAERELAALRKQNETETDKRVREANEAAEAKYKPVAIKAAARAALVEAKVKGDPGRAVKLMDMSAIDIDEDGEHVGLEDQIDLVRAEFPEMFESEDDESEKPKAKPRKAVAKVNPGNKSTPVKENGRKLTSAEKIAAKYENGDYDNL